MGLTGALAGFGLQGCFAPQPVPECTVNTAAAAQGLVPYYVILDKVDSTGGGTCGDFDHMYAGLTRYRTEPSGGPFKVGIKASLIADPAQGEVYAADVDAYNNCVNEEDCLGEDDPTMGCVVLNPDDGGVTLTDGTPVDPSTGTVDAGVDSYDVDLANECTPVEEPVERTDPNDPEGKNLVALGSMPQFPTGGRCMVTDFTGGTQDFEPITVLSGTDLPAISYKVEFTDFTVINTSQVYGTAFTSDVKFTEGTCVANYKARGFWSGLLVGLFVGTPEISCDVEGMDGGLAYAPECDPNADLDAGRSFGSGMSPAFQPLCDVGRKACVPSVDFATLQ